MVWLAMWWIWWAARTDSRAVVRLADQASVDWTCSFVQPGGTTAFASMEDRNSVRGVLLMGVVVSGIGIAVTVATRTRRAVVRTKVNGAIVIGGLFHKGLVEKFLS